MRKLSIANNINFSIIFPTTCNIPTYLWCLNLEQQTPSIDPSNTALPLGSKTENTFPGVTIKQRVCNVTTYAPPCYEGAQSMNGRGGSRKRARLQRKKRVAFNQAREGGMRDDNEAGGHNSVRPPCYDLRKGPRNTATPGRLPMMHAPEVGKRGCMQAYYVTRRDTPPPPFSSAATCVQVVTLSYLCPWPAVLSRRNQQTSKFRGTVRCWAQIREDLRWTFGYLLPVMPNQSSLGQVRKNGGRY